jgi:multiple sugar transport system substrate-binding protein/sn-glycerol 3-phosphate transport system substrate-binding protein
MKKQYLVFKSVWVILMLIIGTGCGSSLSYDTDIYGRLENLDPSGQDITYWYQHSQSREEILQDMIADFNSSNEWGIKVQGEYAGSYGEIYNKIIVGIPLGEIPQITVAYQNQAAIYVTQGAVVELSPYIESPSWGFTEEQLDDFFPFVMVGDYLPQFDGRYGFPPQRSMEVLYFNEDWLRELGYSNPPNTWGEFKKMSCKATDIDKGQYGYVLSVDASTFADMLFNRGGSLVNSDASAYTFGDQAGMEVVTFLYELFEDKCAILESEGYGDRVYFAEGKALFTFSSTSGLPEYRKLVEDGTNFNWSITTMPTSLEMPRVNIYGASLSIMRSTPEKQLASWLFIKWLTEAQQTAHWARYSNYFPVRQSAAESLTDYFAENPEYEKAFNFLSYDIVVEPGLASYQECRDVISELLVAVASGGDPKSLLTVTVDNCNLLLKEIENE